MSDFVKEFDALTPNDWALAGGKGSTLARLLQLGYPVPPGFVILAAAFGAAGELSPDARQQIVAHLQRLRGDTADAPVAVRSSALAEDSAQTSFAGEFESVLNVQTDAEFWAALDRVYRSAQTERVRAYSAAHGVDVAHRIAVVVQHMVPAELAGVLFTADPVSGSYGAMLGNYVHGLGEVLVSGEADAEQFTLTRPKGTYAGPAALRPMPRNSFASPPNSRRRWMGRRILSGRWRRASSTFCKHARSRPSRSAIWMSMRSTNRWLRRRFGSTPMWPRRCQMSFHRSPGALFAASITN
ncbi:MAG: PEP/pyruvate-binding domain-containing protein [Caldilineaceae bacterium]